MKKFDPEKELSKIKNSHQTTNISSKLSNMYVPLLVIACGVLSMIGVAFSLKLTSSNINRYKVKVDIMGQANTTYEKIVNEGAFSDNIPTNSSFGSITCTSGNLSYDSLTSTISSVYVNEDTYCILSFIDEGINSISNEDLLKINDNKGVSYYYKGDANNNFIKINNLLFRIIRINGDGSLRLMLNDVILASNYGQENNFINSNLQSVLNNWYKNTFNNEDYVIESDFDDNYYYAVDEVNHLLNLQGYYIGYVGTLSAQEAKIITDGLSYSYLDTANGILLMNGDENNGVWALKNTTLTNVSVNNILNIRPVICIKADIISGDGTENNPYLID